jgi:hypothetical protein
MWDTCSVGWFKMFNEGYPYGCQNDCTYYPGVTSGCFAPTRTSCGNGVVDPGEECDCGAPEECTDKCCEASTCKLKGACSPEIHGCCTDNCTVSPAGKICRDSVNMCDVAEKCNGTGRSCPVENNRLDFEPCKEMNISGQCYNSKCVSHAIGCAAIPAKYGYDIKGPCPRAIEGDLSCKKLFCERYDRYCTSMYAPELILVQNGTSFAGACKNITTVTQTLPPKLSNRHCVWVNRKKICRGRRDGK